MRQFAPSATATTKAHGCCGRTATWIKSCLQPALEASFPILDPGHRHKIASQTRPGSRGSPAQFAATRSAMPAWGSFGSQRHCLRRLFRQLALRICRHVTAAVCESRQGGTERSQPARPDPE
jgi:hypothetical protein